jgi:hypothetical protein
LTPKKLPPPLNSIASVVVAIINAALIKELISRS